MKRRDSRLKTNVAAFVRLAACFSLTCAVLLCASPALADADEDSKDDTWLFRVTPYAWAMGLNGSIGAGSNTADVDLSVIDIIENADSLLAFNLTAEAHRSGWGLITSVSYTDLDINDAGRLLGDGSLDPSTQLLLVEGAITRQITSLSYGKRADGNDLVVEALVGARYISIKGDLAGARASAGGTVDWAEPFFGARMIAYLNERVSVSFRGDVGGFGAGSDFAGQAITALGYDFESFGTETRSFIGYRASYADYDEGSGDDEVRWDLLLHGVILGVGWTFQ